MSEQVCALPADLDSLDVYIVQYSAERGGGIEELCAILIILDCPTVRPLQNWSLSRLTMVNRT